MDETTFSHGLVSGFSFLCGFERTVSRRLTARCGYEPPGSLLFLLFDLGILVGSCLVLDLDVWVTFGVDRGSLELNRDPMVSV